MPGHLVAPMIKTGEAPRPAPCHVQRDWQRQWLQLLRGKRRKLKLNYIRIGWGEDTSRRRRPHLCIYLGHLLHMRLPYIIPFNYYSTVARIFYYESLNTWGFKMVLKRYKIGTSSLSLAWKKSIQFANIVDDSSTKLVIPARCDTLQRQLSLDKTNTVITFTQFTRDSK